jgi:succinate dehydrogenase / fumarate reductase cytochrome b subunit
MTQVSPAPTPAAPSRPQPVNPSRGPAPWPVRFYRSAIGKKWVMGITGLMLFGFVLTHMVGNLKMYLGPAHYNQYSEWLKTIAEPALPHTAFLWILRSGLILAVLLHIHAAYSLTMMNRRARPVQYQSKRDYVVANFASRTMRWTGIIVFLFVWWHLLDLTWGHGGAAFASGDTYANVVHSFNRWPIAAIYIACNLALGFHLFHGLWSMFQSLGLNNPRWNSARRGFAATFAALVTVGNVSFPVMVLAGVVSLK